jgi:capsular exopolysaccharide synthesis family protein
MTRLTEALERARTAGAVVPAASDSHPETVEVPEMWTFDEPVPGAGQPPSRDLSPDWHVEAPPAVAPMPAAAVPAPVEPSRSRQQPSAARAADAPRVGFSDIAAARLVVDSQSDVVLVEQYRRLAAVLHHAQGRQQIRSVMITSALPAEGKTLTATNLALTLSRSYQKRVLLVDADLRRPSLSAIFEVSNRAGLAMCLRDTQVTRLPVSQVGPNLWLLPAGKPDPNPTSLLTSDAMQQLLAEAVEQFDWVILDTPPVGLMPDASLLAAMVDAAFMVIHAGRTPYPLVRKAVDAIGLERVLGVVLNRADRSSAVDAYDYYGYYQADGSETGGRSGIAPG